MELGETFLNNKVGYRSMVSQNEITGFDIFRTAGPFSRVEESLFLFLLKTLIISFCETLLPREANIELLYNFIC